MNYLLIFLGGLVFWVLFNLIFLWYYVADVQDDPDLSDKFKRRFLLLGLLVPGLNVLMMLLIPSVAILAIIILAIKEEFKDGK